MDTAPVFDSLFREALRQLVLWRRDVRRFKTEPIPSGLVERLVELASHAPSVGNSQPWRFVMVEDKGLRSDVRRHFEETSREALGDYHGEQVKLYAQLKLSGMDKAPVQMAVFADTKTSAGHGLGQKTMPETLRYSVVMAIHTLWLAARAEGIGVGWISIIDPVKISALLDVPEGWSLIAYLCLGYPEEEHLDPELERHDWQERIDIKDIILRR
jgi:5,6-dimethylbenzimidazole synthase